MDRPSPSRAELRTADGLRALLSQLVGELERKTVDWEAITASATQDQATDVVARMKAEFIRAAEPTDVFELDRWLTRELGMDFDLEELAPDARALLFEILVRWIVIVGMLRQPRRASSLAESASAVATNDPDRARVALASCHALVGCGRGDLPMKEAIRGAWAAHARARALGIDDAAARWAELQIRCFAGRANELPVRQRLRHLAAATRLAERLIASTIDTHVREETTRERARLVQDHERLAQLGWFHRLVGFVPDS